MAENGVSKKLCMTAVSVAAIVSLAEGAEDKLPYVIVIGVLCVIYEVAQAYLDRKKNETT